MQLRRPRQLGTGAHLRLYQTSLLIGSIIACPAISAHLLVAQALMLACYMLTRHAIMPSNCPAWRFA